MTQPVDEPFLKSEPHTEGVDYNRKKTAPKNLPDAMIKGLRPKQWVKNVLVPVSYTHLTLPTNREV